MATWSTLDLLDADTGDVEEPLDDTVINVSMDPVRPENDDERRPATSFVVHGETTGTSRSRSMVSKKIPIVATSTRSKSIRNNQRVEANDVTSSRSDKYEAELRVLTEQFEQTKRELAHTREEREEIRMAFQRLDQEIANGYNLTERKEKEMKIAELLTKNQKLSQMLEKELKKQEALRVANVDLHSQVYRLEEQRTLINQVLASLEMKHADLTEAHNNLSADHMEAKKLIAHHEAAVQQREAMDTKSMSQQNQSVEQNRQQWESKCSQLQRMLTDTSALLRAEQDKTKFLDQRCESLLQEKAALENEVTNVHDDLIRINGTMKAMEARMEVSSSNASDISSLDRMKERVRVLDEEVLSKNRLIADLKRSVNDLLSCEPIGLTHKGLKRRSAGTTSSITKSENASNRLVTLTQRLRKAEEARDHKSRCLTILLGALPQLLQQLDALQDKFHATVESNTILSNAIQQLQSNNQVDDHRNESPIALAREGYLLSGPYQPDLLMGYTMNRALSEVAPPPPRKQAKFMPFHVRARVNVSDNGPSQGELLLAADVDDSSGVAFLNRSKVNAFLHFVQGTAAKAKCKHLLVQKIADLLSSQRDLMHNYSTECGYYKASSAKLEVEVSQRAKQTAQLHDEVDRLRQMLDDSSRLRSRPTKLLLKLVEVLADGVDRTQTTFLTQAEGSCTSDMLIGSEDTTNRTAHCWHAPVTLDLSDCGVDDEDLEPLLLKISVCPVPIMKLDLGDNSIGDNGAATIAAFLESCPPSLKVVDLRGNTKISPVGIGRLKNGLVKNPRSCRVDMDSTQNALIAIAVDVAYDTAGRRPIMLEIHLPNSHQGPKINYEQDLQVEQMLQTLESRGFAGMPSLVTRAEAVYRSTKTSSTLKNSKTPQIKRVPLTTSSVTTARSSRGYRSQKEKKFRALELALGPDNPTTKRDTQRGITLTQMQHLLTTRNTRGSSATSISSQRLTKLQFAQSHLATIRGLGKK